MGKGGSQTIGYKYYLGMHLVFCHGPIDAVKQLRVDDRVAWETGQVNTAFKLFSTLFSIISGTAPEDYDGVGSGALVIKKPNLFGGKEREGGIEGRIDIAMGAQDQGQNDYLAAKVSTEVPGFRGVVSAIFRQVYLGNNPYLKAWSMVGQRIHWSKDGDEQWYDAKAAIEVNSGSGAPVDLTAEFPVLTQGVDGTYPTPTSYYPHSITIGPYDNDAEIIAGNPDGTGFCRADDFFFFNGVKFGTVDATTWPAGTVMHTLAAGSTVTIQIQNTINPYSGVTGSFHVSFAGIGIWDMNPAHIIRECLTDPNWGMGYNEADIDDTAFTAAADQLYSEGLGISLLWDRQSKLEDFIMEIVKHIDAALYVSRTTGKFVLKLIRADYDIGDLITLDESNIQKISNPSRPSIGELANSVTVNYYDAVTYQDASLTVTDTALVQMQGAVINTTVQYPGLTSARTASIAAQRDLRTLSSPLLTCTVYCDQTARSFNVGDVFLLSWAKWNISELPMRITGIALGDGKSNQVRITCVEDVFSTNTTLQVVTSGGTEWVDPSQPPTEPDQVIAFEVPYYELVQRLGQTEVDTRLATNNEIGYVMAAAAQGTSGAISARVWTDAGAGYENRGPLDFSPSAVLTNAITPTQTSIIFESGDNLDEVATGTLFQIDGELCRIDTLDTTTGVATIGRGVLDTVPVAHAAGSRLYFWDEYSGFDPTEYALGETVDVKVVPISGAGQLEVDDVTAHTVDLAQRAFLPYPPGDFRVETESYTQDASYTGVLDLSWAHRDRILQTSGVLYDHTEGDIGPEASTVYRIRGYLNDVLDHTEDDISGTSTTYTPSGEGQVTVLADSKRDGLYSWQAATHTFYYTATDARLDQDGTARADEDGDIRMTED